MNNNQPHLLFKYVRVGGNEDRENLPDFILNTDATVSFNGGPDHGSWRFYRNPDQLHISFHCRGDETNLRQLIFIKIQGTSSWMFKSEQGPEWTVILIPKTLG